eukprot:COSAG06_NODE_15123_length_1096_cov_1.040120_1_plen_77_part_10
MLWMGVEGWCKRTVVAEAEGRLGPMEHIGCRILLEGHWLDRLSVLSGFSIAGLAVNLERIAHVPGAAAWGARVLGRC